MTEEGGVFAVILAGGSGTRFWPASRALRPKQLLALGPSSASLIRETVRRIAPLSPPERVLIATGKRLLVGTREALPELPASAFLGEPQAKNTAPCIGWASAVAFRRDPEAVVMVLPSDQHIGDEPAFLDAVRRAVASARDGVITTIGVEPTRAETGYGYIEVGDAVAGCVSRVARFVEKPDAAKAAEYLASGRYVWNSGMFFFRAREMLDALRAHAPAIAEGLDDIEAAVAAGAAAEAEATERAFEAFPSISIDYAVMERAERLHVVSASFGWSDLGSWQSAWELSPKDAAQNAAPQGSILVDASGNIIRTLAGAEGKLVALVGVEGLAVVDTGDALLVMPRERSQDVRAVVDALKASGREPLL
jgi:mannose-1-phosphate guanylyltransferase